MNSNIGARRTSIGRIETSSLNKKSILKPSNQNDSEHTEDRDTNKIEIGENGQTQFSVNDFSNNLNKLCLKTPKRKKIIKDEHIKKSVKNKVTFDPPPGSFNITFDTSESESENEEIILDAVVETFKTTPPQQPLTGVTVFVDVRAENENRSKAISRELERMGATIADKISSQVTHVVFKDGRQGTLTQLKKHSNVHFVSVLWVDACKTIGCKVNEGLYPARNPKEDNVGLPLARVKRVKSLQPKTFEEDVTNSAKKEDRRRKRLRKLDKDFGTPTDQIICLDSQEYIKSSDLHKLVATPLAIPDTPWILNYINGSDKEDNDVSPDTICCKQNLNDSTDMKRLSQDVQCRLNFDTGTPVKKISSCLIDIGSSPSKQQQKKQFEENEVEQQQRISDEDIVKPTPKKAYFAKRTTKSPSSTVTRKHKTEKKASKSLPPKTSRDSKAECCTMSSTSFTTSIISSSTTTKNIGNTSSPLANVSPLRQKSTFPDNPLSSSPLKRKSPAKITYTSKTTTASTLDVDVVVPKPQVIKKKKRLMSKSHFLVPQEKLISPALKNDANKSKVNKNEDDVLKKRRQPTTTTSKTERPNAFTVLQQLGQSKKDNAETTTIMNETQSSRDNTKSATDLKAAYSSILEDTILQKPTDLDYRVMKKPAHNTKPSQSDKEQMLLQNKKDTEPGHTDKEQILGRNTKEQIPLRNTKEVQLGHTETIQSLVRRKKISNSVKNTKILDESEQKTSGKTSHQNDVYKETDSTETESSKIDLQRRRSTRLSRRSSIDFQIGQKFTKTKSLLKEVSQSTDIQSSPVPEEFSLTNNEPLGLNISFVHDENEGLVCTSQEHGTVYQVTEDEESEIEMVEGDVMTNGGDIDSGISDSEEVLHEEEEEVEISKQMKERTISTVGTGKSDTVVENISMQSTSTSNGTINRSNSIKRCKQSLVCTSLHFSEQGFAKGVIKQLKEFKLKKNIAPDTTHVIAGSKRRTLNILHAISQGCWILNPKWLSDSFEANCWLCEEDYEMHEEFPAAKVSRLNRQRHGKSSCTRLFSKLPRIFLAEVTSPPHEEMMRLIVSCGGQLTNAIRKAGIAIGLVTCRRSDVKILSEKWILDSITNGHLMPTKDYEYRTSFFERERSPDY